MRRVLVIIPVALALLGAATAPGSTSAPNAGCKYVTKKVGGKRRRVRVCPKPTTALPAVGKVAASVPLSAGVVDLDYGEGALWATLENGKLVRVDPATNSVTATVDTPSGEWPPTVRVGNGAVWLGVPNPNTLVRIDPQTAAITARIPVGDSPEGIAFTPGAVWTANHRSDSGDPRLAASKPVGRYSVSRVDPATNAETARVVLESRNDDDSWARYCCGPQGLTAAAGSVWAGDAGKQTVFRIDPSASAVTAIHMPSGIEACGALAGDDSAVWVAAGCDEARVVRIDPATNRVAAVVTTKGTAGDVRVGLGAVWVSAGGGGANQLERIDPATNKIVAATHIDDPRALAVGGGAVWIGSGAGILRFQPAS